MDFITLITFTILIITLYKFWGFRNLPPGPYGLPIIGYSLFLGNKPHVTFKKLAEKYGDIYCINILNKNVVVLNNYNYVNEVLVKQGHIFSGRPQMFAMDTMFEKKDVITHFGSIWKKQKQLTRHSLREFGVGTSTLESIIFEEVDIITQQLLDTHEKPTEITSFFFNPILNIIWGITAGKRFDSADENTINFGNVTKDLGKVLSNVHILSNLPFLRFMAPNATGFTELCLAKQTLCDYIQREVDEHIKKFDENSIIDFIDRYLAEIKRNELENKNTHAAPYTKEHLIFTILDLFFGGTESTCATLSYAILQMALHLDIQEKVYKELHEVMRDDSYLSQTSKSKIPYTEATILEIFRFSSVAPLGVFHSSVQDTTIGGYDIPKGTTVINNLWGVHHDVNYWGDPDCFRPERFLDDIGKVKKHDCFLPFGKGPRACLGETLARMEIFIFFTCLINRFSFELIPDEENPSLEPMNLLVLRPQPFSVIARRR